MQPFGDSLVRSRTTSGSRCRQSNGREPSITAFHAICFHSTLLRRADISRFWDASPRKSGPTLLSKSPRAGARLKIAAKVDRADQAYWKNIIKPMINSSPNVESVGEIGDRDKGTFSETRTPCFF